MLLERKVDPEKSKVGPVTSHREHAAQQMQPHVLNTAYCYPQQRKEKSFSEGSWVPHRFSFYLPMQAVWCWVNPGGHLHVKPPMVLTHRN